MPKKRNKTKAIIFDMDGVLINVNESYRISVKRTAEFFLGKILDMSEVEEVRNKDLSDVDSAEFLIQRHGGDFRKKVIIKKFREFYLGRQFDGFVTNEKALVKDEVFKKLKDYDLAIFTGRSKEEAKFGLMKFKMGKYFKTVIVGEDVKKGKPHPEGLLKIIKQLGIKNSEAVYVGDSLVDLRAANSANVSFIGVCPPGSDKSYVKKVLTSEGAEIVLNNVKDILKVIK